MRKLHVRVVDTAGCEAVGCWPVREDQNDSLEDGVSLALALYEHVAPDDAPTSIQITATFMQEGSRA
jgi:hypothetical protein